MNDKETKKEARADFSKVWKQMKRLEKAVTHEQHRKAAVSEYVQHLKDVGHEDVKLMTFHQTHKLARLQRWAEKAKDKVSIAREKLTIAKGGEFL